MEDSPVGWWAVTDLSAARARLRLAQQYQADFVRLEDEITNLRASRDWLASNLDNETAPLLISYVRTLAPYLRQRGLGNELLRWCEDAIHACKILDEECNWLLLLRGEAQNSVGQWHEAIVSIREVIQTSKGIDPEAHAQAILNLGRLQLNQGEYQIALETLARAEQLLLEQSDYVRLATAQSEVAAYHLNRRELDKALSLYLEAAALREKAGATELSDHMLLMLGVVYRKKEEYERSIHYLQQLLDRSETQGNQGGIATAAHHLAWVYLNQGQIALAHQLCGRAIDLYDRTGDIRGASDAYEQLGLIVLAEEKIELAISYLDRSLIIRRQIGNQHGEASSLRHLGLAHLKTGHLITGARALWQSLVLYGELGMLTHQRMSSMWHELVNWIIGKSRQTV